MKFVEPNLKAWLLSGKKSNLREMSHIIDIHIEIPNNFTRFFRQLFAIVQAFLKYYKTFLSLTCAKYRFRPVFDI